MSVALTGVVDMDGFEWREKTEEMKRMKTVGQVSSHHPAKVKLLLMGKEANEIKTTTTSSSSSSNTS